MKLLLDTHILMWALADDARLSEKARSIISDERNELYYSVVSAWEVSIKHALHPESFDLSEEALIDYCEQNEILPLSLSIRHIPVLSSLKRSDSAPAHKDPFDRVMIAQAKSDGLMFVTHDRLIADYDEACILIV